MNRTETSTHELEDLASRAEDLRARGILLALPNEEILELIRSFRREVNTYEQDASTEREKLLNRLTPIIERLDELLSSQRFGELVNKLREVDGRLEAMEEGQDSLQERMEERNEFARQVKEENKQLREEFVYEEKLKPGVREIINLRDTVNSQLRDQELGEKRRIFLEAVDDKLLATLNKLGVDEVEKDGAKFDPSCQDAVEKTTVLEKKKDGKVLEIFQAGYRRKEKTIRPQKVLIGKFNGGEGE